MSRALLLSLLFQGCLLSYTFNPKDLLSNLDLRLSKTSYRTPEPLGQKAPTILYDSISIPLTLNRNVRVSSVS